MKVKVKVRWTESVARIKLVCLTLSMREDRSGDNISLQIGFFVTVMMNTLMPVKTLIPMKMMMILSKMTA